MQPSSNYQATRQHEQIQLARLASRNTWQAEEEEFSQRFLASIVPLYKSKFAVSVAELTVR